MQKAAVAALAAKTGFEAIENTKKIVFLLNRKNAFHLSPILQYFLPFLQLLVKKFKLHILPLLIPAPVYTLLFLIFFSHSNSLYTPLSTCSVRYTISPPVLF